MLYISVLSLAIAALCLGAVEKSLTARILLLLFYLALILSTAFFLIADYFTGMGISDTVIYTLAFELQGAGWGGYFRLIITSLLAVLAVLVFLYLAEFRRLAGRRLAAASSTRVVTTGLLAAVIAVAANPAAADLYRLASRAYPAAGRDSRGAASPEEASFSSAYREPLLSKMPAARRSFVFIEAESLERTYLDQSLFPDLLPRLRELMKEGTSFANLLQVNQLWWSIGGMVAAQCGVPLVTYSGGNSYSGMGAFLPGARCLGDLLRQAGYAMEHLNSARLSFGGVGRFHRQHGFSVVEGADELLPAARDPAYASPWGLHDDSLFETAYDRFEQLAGSGEPFGLFVTTMDTHHPSGFPSRSCAGAQYGDGGNKMLNAVHCADFVISSFLDRLRASRHGGDVIIVLASDHLAMNNDAHALLNKGRRRNLFWVWDPRSPLPAEVEAGATALDIGPTVLHLLGFSARLGLGRNVLREPSLSYAVSRQSGSLPQDWLDGSAELWRTDHAERLAIDVPARTVSINGRPNALPILVQLGLTTSDRYYFGFDDERDLLSYLAEFPADAPFIYIDTCDRTGVLAGGRPPTSPQGYCLIASKMGALPIRDTELNGTLVLDKPALDSVRDLGTDAASARSNRLKILEAGMSQQMKSDLLGAAAGQRFFRPDPGACLYFRLYAEAMGLQVEITCADPTPEERKLIPYRLGSTIDFTRRGNSADFRVSGWLAPETTGTWTADCESRLDLNLERPPSSDIRATFELIPLVRGAALPCQKLLVSANGAPIADLCADREGSYSFIIPRNLSSSSLLALRFEIPTAASPKALGAWDFDSPVGVHVKSLRLTAAD